MGITNSSRAILPGLLASLALAGCSPSGQSDSVPSLFPANPRPSNGARAPARDTLAESLPYADIDSDLVYGYFAIPSDMIDPLPAIVLVHDTSGLDDGMKAVADRLAGDGYIVLAVDLYRGRPTATAADIREREIELVENHDQTLDNLRQAFAFIRASTGAPSVAVTGFGLGGGWALTSMLQLPDSIDAAVSFYGQVRNNREVLQQVDVPFLGFFLESDRAVKAESVRDFEEAMQSLSKDVFIRIYEEGDPGFAMPGAEAYDSYLADEAWSVMLAFLEQRLGRP